MGSSENELGCIETAHWIGGVVGRTGQGFGHDGGVSGLPCRFPVTMDQPEAWGGLPRIGPEPAAEPWRGDQSIPQGPRCPLPVVRANTEGWAATYHVEACGEPLALDRIAGATIDGDGLGYMVPRETVTCMAGHTLLVPDAEDHEVELTPELVTAALLMLEPVKAVPMLLSADDVGRMLDDLPPVEPGECRVSSVPFEPTPMRPAFVHNVIGHPLLWLDGVLGTRVGEWVHRTFRESKPVKP